MAVQSTVTSTDLLAERKELMLEINGLKRQRELDREEEKRLAKAKTALLASIDELEVSHKEKQKSHEKEVSAWEDRIGVLKEAEKKHLVTIESAKKTHLSLLEQHEVVKKGHSTKSKELSAVQESISQHLDLFNKMKVANQGILESIEGQIATAKVELIRVLKQTEDYMNEYRAKVEFISAEEKKLSDRASDLAIYESRLRAKYAELMPEMEIIL